MSRTTPAEVKQIKDTDLSDPVLQVWIDAANTIVTEAESCINGSEEKLDKIELYLSSHFIELLEPDSGSRIRREKADDLEVEYAIKEVANSINETVYGKTANMLSKGCLANLDKAAICLISTGHIYDC